ncbi:MAG: 1,2-phenylacetyl-CoA epoxidase subunit PaaD [Planctomycetota bacterium]
MSNGRIGSGNRHSTFNNSSIAAIWCVLEAVVDAEILVINVVEMGMIAGVDVKGDCVAIDVTPAFVGCPALDVIRENIRTAVSAVTPAHVTVNVVVDPSWTSDRISANGRESLKAFGLAPPGQCCSGGSVQTLERTPCPYCNSLDTDLESVFGPPLCRSIHYRRSCLQAFEHFKAV